LTGPENLDRARERNFIALASNLYLIMHAGILFIPSAIFWDDWVFADTAKEITLETFNQLGSMLNLNEYLHVRVNSVGIWIYKAFIILLTGRSDHTSSAKDCKSCNNRLFPTRYATHCSLAPGWRLIDTAYWPRDFGFSFKTNSLFVFYALPILDLANRSSGLLSISTLFKVTLKRWEL